MELIVTAAGEVRCVYDEALQLDELGTITIVRASHVEPDVAGLWWSDLGPVDGPTLGPFRARSAALIAEQKWLAKHWLSLC